jgi:hypothetical protein
MILMLSGEGKTDMGQMVPTAKGMRFDPGPMAWIVDRLIENRLKYSLIEGYNADSEGVSFVAEKELNERGKKDPAILPGIKRGKGTALFVRNTNTLGLMAKALQKETSTDVIAVLFRDTDSTNSASRRVWQDKYDSMKCGFQRAGFPHGVAMLPLPKSEAWLLCALKQDSYQRCDALEDASGNDDSPNSLKNRLNKLIGHDADAQEQAEWVRSGKVDPEQIDMPSYNAFRNELNSVLNAVVNNR